MSPRRACNLSSIGSAPAVSALPPRPRTHGFLRIARHGVGPGAMYVITYHRLEPREDAHPRPVAAESAQALIELLERIGIDFHACLLLSARGGSTRTRAQWW